MRDYALPEYDASTLTQSKAMAVYFEGAAGASGQPKLASNWIMGEISRRVNSDDLSFERLPMAAATLADLLVAIDKGDVSNSAAKQVFEALWNAPRSADGTGLPQGVQQTIDALGLRQMNDSGALEQIVDTVIAANPDNVAQFRAGKDKAFNALVGQVMKASKGKANPAQVNELLRARLSG
jgi:aspartyl-tRNA(Asn)/glutamyl-tRNA(Gln) amidotransferase subunit B